MNLILGNLSNLKAAVLPEDLRAMTDWDNALADLARGVAASMQTFCNRRFERIEDDTFERAADCSYLSLPRFPVEEVSLLELKVDETSGFGPLPANTIWSLIKQSGLVEFGGRLMTWDARVRVTYTGGFWADYTEDNSGTQPDGSTAVPADLIHAWHLQVQNEIESTNLLRGVAAKRTNDKAETATSDLKLITRVREILHPFVRYS
jgi:hypothetical protein